MRTVSLTVSWGANASTQKLTISTKQCWGNWIHLSVSTSKIYPHKFVSKWKKMFPHNETTFFNHVWMEMYFLSGYDPLWHFSYICNEHLFAICIPASSFYVLLTLIQVNNHSSFRTTLFKEMIISSCKSLIIFDSMSLFWELPILPHASVESLKQRDK